MRHLHPLTAIAAETLHDARQAAFNLGLSPEAWIYPDASYKLREPAIERIVLVTGWHRSATIPLGAMIELQERVLNGSLEIIEQPTTEGVLLSQVRADLAADELARERRVRPGSIPTAFVEPAAVIAAAAPAVPWWRSLIRAVIR